MATPAASAREILARILHGGTPEDRAAALRPRPPSEEPLPPRMPKASESSEKALARRIAALGARGIRVEALQGRGADLPAEALEGHTEGFVGFARVPVGVVGPLRVNGTEARGDFYVPLATTEGALVASYQRGAWVASLAGGVSAICLEDAVSRAPCFSFSSLREAGLFIAWVLGRIEGLRGVVAETTRHGRLTDVRPSLAGKDVYLILEFSTGEAAGQNMATFAAEAICERLVRESPVKPRRWYVEGNLSGDKKATMLAFLSARGKKVVAEVEIPRAIVRRWIRAEPAELVRYWEVSVLGGIQSGSIGVQGHVANALAALFIACGQDAACVSEAAVGITRMDVTDAGALYASASLPNLIVGTVGGGTSLPTARECLRMIGCEGPGSARKLAEIAAATALAGEVSILGALAGGYFGRAHRTYGRKRARG